MSKEEEESLADLMHYGWCLRKLVDGKWVRIDPTDFQIEFLGSSDTLEPYEPDGEET